MLAHHSFHRTKRPSFIARATLLALLQLCLGLLVGDGNLSLGAAQQPTATMVLMGGNVWTVDVARPTAQAIAIQRDRILAVGSNEAIRQYIGNETEVIDLEGKFVMPGFIEGHAHFVGLGESMMMLNLHQAKKWDDIVQQVADAAKTTPPGEWIVGRGWHQSKWDQPPSPNVEGYPTADAIDKVAPDNPVLLRHASGHMSFANGYAMRLAGVTEQTANPNGGEILKLDSGKPVGVFRETAQGLVDRIYAQAQAKRTLDEKADYMRRAIELASQNCFENGITSFQDAGSTLEVVDQLKYFASEGKLGVRLYVMIRDANERMQGRLAGYKMIGYGNEFLTVRALKRSIDGALGPHGAWLLADYEDLPGSSGLNTATVESVTRTAELAIENDFQMCVHAIGDRANRETLDIYEKLFQQHPVNTPRRWRVEHAQHLHPDDIPRFGKLGVIAAMQAVHCTSDAVFVPKRLGFRRSAEGAYVWQSLLKSGAIVTNGTDAPVEDINPLASLYASVTRRLSKDVTFFPEQVMTREQAIRSYTLDCAYSAFEETSKGSLVAGKLADIVVLDQDLLKCDEELIKQAKVQLTIVGGKVVYARRTDE